MNDTLLALADHRIVPVVVIDDAGRAAPLARALADAGLPCAEITLRTDEALRALEAAAAVEGFVAGAGTVLHAEQAARAVDAGARFLVSPGLSRPVLDVATRAGVPLLPGAVTATEVMAALDLGLSVLKFFPAGTSGGPAGLRALAGPFPDVAFMPTGGITPENLPDYLGIPEVLAVGGTWITGPALLARGDFAAISQLASSAVASARAHPPTPTTARTAS